jgi:hypothetical protein
MKWLGWLGLLLFIPELVVGQTVEPDPARVILQFGGTKEPFWQSLHRIDLTPDGKILVTVSDSDRGRIRLWDTSNGKSIRVLDSDKGSLGFDLSPDGKKLVTTSNNPEEMIAIYEVETGKKVSRFPGKAIECDTFTWSEDERQIVVIAKGEPHQFLRFDVAKSTIVERVPLRADVVRVDRLPDGQHFLASTEDFIYRFDPALPHETRSVIFPMHSGRGDYSLSPDRKFMLTKSYRDKVPRIYETTSMLELFRFDTKSIPQSVAFAGNQNLLFVGDPWGKIRLFDFPSGIERESLSITGAVRQMRMPRDGRFLLCWEHRESGDRIVILKMNPLPRRLSSPSNNTRFTLSEAWERLSADTEQIEVLKAMADLIEHPRSMEYFREKLQPIREVNPKELEPSIQRLDHARFTIREQASRQLEAMGPVVLPRLRTIRDQSQSVEQIRLLDRIIKRLTSTTVTPEQLRQMRAISILEQLNTDESRLLLKRISEGAVGQPLTEDGRLAWNRLKKMTP